MVSDLSEAQDMCTALLLDDSGFENMAEIPPRIRQQLS